MASREAPRIVVVGSGNVASHLARALDTAGANVMAIVSRKLDHAQALAASIPGCIALNNPADIADLKPDFVLISVSDDALASVVESLPTIHGIAMHTSGTCPASVLASKSKHYGVLYPLQTFSKDQALDISAVPFFTEGSDPATLAAIDRIASMLSARVAHADSEHRRTLHIAGVFACNFVTCMWDCARRVLEADGYDFSAVVPLIEATLQKAIEIGPFEAQTGPARRGDQKVMLSHIEQLSEPMRSIYRTVSDAIIEFRKKQS